MPKTATDSSLGFEKKYNRVWTSTEQLPTLLNRLGFPEESHRLIRRLLNAIMYEDFSTSRKKPRKYDLTDVTAMINGPSFDKWFRTLPMNTVTNTEYNGQMLKHFAQRLIQSNIVIPAERDINMRPDRKAVP